MKIRDYLRKWLVSAMTLSLVASLSLSQAHADGAGGAIVGIVTTPAKLPVAHATVTARRVDGGGIRATISGSDGVYSFADLPPGQWAISSEIEGSPEVVGPAVTVVQSKATRQDIVMNAPAGASAAQAPALAAVVKEAAGNGAAPVPAVPKIAEALQAPDPAPENDTMTPLANDGDIGWMNGNTRGKGPAFDTKFFTPEIRLDVNYLQSGNHPIDHTVVGSTEEFRSSEFQIEQVSFGGDFHWDNVRARFLSMFGMFATTTPRNDASRRGRTMGSPKRLSIFL